MAIGSAGLVLLSGCHGSGHTSAHHSNPAAGAMIAGGDRAKGAAALDRLKALEGEWDLVGDDGKRGPGLVIHATAAGSAVQEVMFPGAPHEMTNMYHADGGSLLMTHYCAVGNQPRMRAAATGTGAPLTFQFESVSNLGGRDDTYMGFMELTIVDANTIRQDWNHFSLNKGKSADQTSMTFKRKGT
jgi:hypothetical protein